MSPATLSTYVLAGGERVLFLRDDRGVPLFYPTLFTTTQLRNAGAAANTIRNKLLDVVVLMRWERTHGREILEEFRRGSFLSPADIASIRDFAKLDMRYLDAGTRKGRAGAAGVHFMEASVSSPEAAPAVEPQQHYNRLSTIAEYLEFCATVITQHSDSKATSDQVRRMANTIRKHRPRGLAKRVNEDAVLRSPPSELIDRFMAVAAADNPTNPFRNEGVRLRNAIIFGVLRFAGMRRGELLSLRIDQVDFGDEPLLWVRRNQDDRHDPRPNQPSSKTLERPIPIPDSLANQIHTYILKFRSKIPPARRHPYLLVSHKKGATWGRPLSLSSISSRMFAEMRKVDDAFSGIHPHAFRHNMNYELSVRIDRINASARESNGEGPRAISAAREADMRAYLNGHRSTASAVVYNRRHVREESERAMRGLHSDLAKKVSRGDGDVHE